jgi:hypothetical protein
MSEFTSVYGDPLRPTPAEQRARQTARPALHRATGTISFRPLADEVAKAQPGSLRAFLLLHGVRSVVVEEVPTMPEVRLLGVPDLHRVQELIEE